MNDSQLRELILALHTLGAVQFGTFTLKSGDSSPVYLDLRLLVSDPPTLALAAKAYAVILAGLHFDRLAGIPYAALPIGTAVALETGRPLIYPRRELKAYGTGKAVEGRFAPGETAVVLDDVISSGASKLEAIAALEAAGLRVKDVVVLVDRESRGAAEIEAAGYRVHRALTLTEIARVLADTGRITAAEHSAVREYLQQQRAGSHN